jgi:hypothetical protein
MEVCGGSTMIVRSRSWREARRLARKLLQQWHCTRTHRGEMPESAVAHRVVPHMPESAVAHRVVPHMPESAVAHRVVPHLTKADARLRPVPCFRASPISTKLLLVLAEMPRGLRKCGLAHGSLLSHLVPLIWSRLDLDSKPQTIRPATLST